MFGQWLALPGLAILLTLLLFYGLTALAMYCVSYGRGGRPRLSTFVGIAPPFLSIPTVLFGLMAGFLASDVWNHAREAARAVLDERDGALAIESISLGMPVNHTELDSMVHIYVRAVLSDEWATDDERGAPAVQSALEALVREVASPEIAKEAGTSVQGALLAAVSRIASARTTRLALVTNEADEVKWATVLGLAFLAQLGVAAVHLERPRAQIGALVIFTSCAVVTLSLIAVCERPFEGSYEVSSATLRAVLPP
ncbi:MAG: DUF4239 domain-containing protein [Acetobacteraceae bacterium]|nr:DUF4239 domain-containing protein [Acetobacteraceae bacterium]